MSEPRLRSTEIRALLRAVLHPGDRVLSTDGGSLVHFKRTGDPSRTSCPREASTCTPTPHPPRLVPPHPHLGPSPRHSRCPHSRPRPLLSPTPPARTHAPARRNEETAQQASLLGGLFVVHVLVFTTSRTHPSNSGRPNRR